MYFYELFTHNYHRNLTFKELFDDICSYCQKTTPSNRDRALLKDLPLLLWQIVNQRKYFDKKLLRISVIL